MRGEWGKDTFTRWSKNTLTLPWDISSTKIKTQSELYFEATCTFLLLFPSRWERGGGIGSKKDGSNCEAPKLFFLCGFEDEEGE